MLVSQFDFDFYPGHIDAFSKIGLIYLFVRRHRLFKKKCLVYFKLNSVKYYFWVAQKAAHFTWTPVASRYSLVLISLTKPVTKDVR